MIAALAVCFLVGIGCSSVPEAPVASLPYALSTNSGVTLRIGEPVPDARPGQVVAYADLHLPDGADRAWVEVDTYGNARSFELWYAPERTYEEVVRHYEIHLGPPSRHYERLAGACVVWEDDFVQFEVCRSREPGEHGLIIAHVWPRPPH